MANEELSRTQVSCISILTVITGVHSGGIILPNGGGGECRQLLPQAEEGSLAEL